MRNPESMNNTPDSSNLIVKEANVIVGQAAWNTLRGYEANLSKNGNRELKRRATLFLITNVLK